MKGTSSKSSYKQKAPQILANTSDEQKYLQLFQNSSISNSPVPTVSAADQQPMLLTFAQQLILETGSAKRRSSKTNSLTNSLYNGSKKKSVNFGSMYDPNRVSPSKYMRPILGKKDSYLTYLMSQDFESHQQKSNKKQQYTPNSDVKLRLKDSEVRENIRTQQEEALITYQDEDDTQLFSEQNCVPNFDQVRSIRSSTVQNENTPNKNVQALKKYESFRPFQKQKSLCKQILEPAKYSEPSQKQSELTIMRRTLNNQSATLLEKSHSSSRLTPSAKMVKKNLMKGSMCNPQTQSQYVTPFVKFDQTPVDTTADSAKVNMQKQAFSFAHKMSQQVDMISPPLQGRKQSTGNQSACVQQPQVITTLGKADLTDQSSSSYEITAEDYERRCSNIQKVTNNMTLYTNSNCLNNTVTEGIHKNNQFKLQESTKPAHLQVNSQVMQPKQSSQTVLSSSNVHQKPKAQISTLNNSSKKKKKKTLPLSKPQYTMNPISTVQNSKFVTPNNQYSNGKAKMFQEHMEDHKTKKDDYHSNVTPFQNSENMHHKGVGGKNQYSNLKLGASSRLQSTTNSKKNLLPSSKLQSQSTLTQIINQTHLNSNAIPTRQTNLPSTSSSTQQKKKVWNLTDTEKQTYGDRVPKGYEKLDLLGKGGCALVWLGKNMETKEVVALKQFPKTKSNQLDTTARVEVHLGRILFPKNQNGVTECGVDPLKFPGIRHIAKLIDDIEEQRDYWLVYEVGSQSLSKHLFDVKGEFYKGERIYHVAHQNLFMCIKKNPSLLKVFIRKMAETFQVLSELKIIHADIKPDNVLVSFNGHSIYDMKLIDFGSAFSFDSPSNIQASTPEYLAPEVLEYLENRAQNTQANGTNSSNLCKKLQPWSYDVWSLGAILLEFLTGFPLWLSLKGRITTSSGKSMIGIGILGVQGREGKKILVKQQQLLKNLPHTLKKFDCFGLDKDPNFMNLLEGMLDFNPLTRISPQEILNHPYLK